eukprot:COSAG02_NODE_4586_length_5189_cov_5.995678_5_plen_114_part_00
MLSIRGRSSSETLYGVEQHACKVCGHQSSEQRQFRHAIICRLFRFYNDYRHIHPQSLCDNLSAFKLSQSVSFVGNMLPRMHVYGKVSLMRFLLNKALIQFNSMRFDWFSIDSI